MDDYPEGRNTFYLIEQNNIENDLPTSLLSCAVLFPYMRR